MLNPNGNDSRRTKAIYEFRNIVLDIVDLFNHEDSETKEALIEVFSYKEENDKNKKSKPKIITRKLGEYAIVKQDLIEGGVINLSDT